MEAIGPVLKTLAVPVLLYLGMQSAVLYFIGNGSSQKIRSQLRSQLVWGTGLFLVIILLGFLRQAGSWPLIFGTILLCLWLVSHQLAYVIARRIEGKRSKPDDR